MRRKISRASAWSSTSDAYSAAIAMSAVARATAPRRASSRRTASARACGARRRRPRSRRSVRSARPAPNQPGTIWRDWFHANTHGIARRSSIVFMPDAPRRARPERQRADLLDGRRLREVLGEARVADERAVRLEAHVGRARERRLVLGQLLVGRVVRDERRAQNAARRQLEVAHGDLGQEVLPPEHLALLGQLEATLDRPRRQALDGALRGPAAAPDRAAAPVEDRERDAVAPADLRARALRAVERERRREDPGVLVRVGVADHDLLRAGRGARGTARSAGRRTARSSSRGQRSRSSSVSKSGTIETSATPVLGTVQPRAAREEQRRQHVLVAVRHAQDERLGGARRRAPAHLAERLERAHPRCVGRRGARWLGRAPRAWPAAGAGPRPPSPAPSSPRRASTPPGRARRACARWKPNTSTCRRSARTCDRPACWPALAASDRSMSASVVEQLAGARVAEVCRIGASARRSRARARRLRASREAAPRSSAACGGTARCGCAPRARRRGRGAPRRRAPSDASSSALTPTRRVLCESSAPERAPSRARGAPPRARRGRAPCRPRPPGVTFGLPSMSAPTHEPKRRSEGTGDVRAVRERERLFELRVDARHERIEDLLEVEERVLHLVADARPLVADLVGLPEQRDLLAEPAAVHAPTRPASAARDRADRAARRCAGACRARCAAAPRSGAR